LQVLAILCDLSRAVRPEGFDLYDPIDKDLPEAASGGILGGAELRAKAAIPEEWHVGRAAAHRPALPYHPHVEVEHPRRVRERGDHLAFDRDSVLVDLLVECLAEADDVFVALVTWRLFGPVFVEPKPHPIKKMKTRSIYETAAIWLVFGPEEDRRGEDAMEALHNSAVMAAVLGEPEEVQHLSSAFEMDNPAFLLNGERRYPDGNEAVLAEGQAVFRVASDIEKQPAVPAGVNQLRSGRSAKRNPTENERPGIVSELLLPIVPLLADEGHGLELTKPELCDSERRQAGVEW